MAMHFQVEFHWASDCRSYPIRKIDEIKSVVVHRIEVSQEDPAFPDTPAGIERFFGEHPVGRAATGGRMPYPILIAADGTVTQTVPLLHITPHARVHNPTAIGVACIGDFRHHPPTDAQRQALVLVCSALLADLHADSGSLFGHDELPGARADLSKVCPGNGLDVGMLRTDVATEMNATERMDVGFIWA
jgi:hypothetical protein